MNTEHPNTTPASHTGDEMWDVFLPDGEHEPEPEEGDFWFDLGEDDPR